MITQPCGSISAAVDDVLGGAPEPATIRPVADARIRDSDNGSGASSMLSATSRASDPTRVRYTYWRLASCSAEVRAVCSHGWRRRNPIRYWCSRKTSWPGSSASVGGEVNSGRTASSPPNRSSLTPR